MKSAAITKQNSQVLPLGGRLWNPTHLRDLITWLSPRRNFSKTLGDGLAQWDDSLRNTTFAQGATNRMPTLTQEKATFNGLLVPDFDGGDDLMADLTPTDLLDVGDGDFFIMAAIKTGVVGASSIVNLQKENSNEQIDFGIVSVRAGARIQLAVTSLNVVQSSVALTNNTEYLIYCERVNNVINVYQDGVLAGGGANSTVVIDNNAASILGSSDASVPTNTFDGKIAEVVIGGSTRKNIIGTRNRQRLEGYMAHNCGIADNLPSDHPYKNAPPRF